MYEILNKKSFWLGYFESIFSNIYNFIWFINFIDLSVFHPSDTSSESQNEMKSRFLLDVIVRKSSSVFELLSCEDKSLLIGWDTFLVLDFSFDIFDGVSWFNVKGDGFTSEGFYENLHSSSKSENQVKSGLFLDVIVGESSAIFKLLSSEDESLLIRWDTFCILNVSLDIFNGICWLNIKCDGFTSKCLDEDLHTSSESKNQMEG